MLGPKALARGGDATMPTHTSPMQLSMGSLIRRAGERKRKNVIEERKRGQNKNKNKNKRLIKKE